MKITKNKVIAAVAIIALLIAAFWYGGGAPGLQGWNVSSKDKDTVSEAVQENDADKKAEADLGESDKAQDEKNNSEDDKKSEDVIPEEQVNDKKTESEKETGESNVPKPGLAEGELTADEKVALAKELVGAGSSPGVEKGSKTYSESQGMIIDEKTGKDKYLTDPVPEGKPVPVEPQNVQISDVEYTCTLSVRCDTILNNMDWLDPEKTELVPEDGVIFPATKVTFYEGESVFNVLQREMKKSKIHMEFKNTPIYNSAYIEGINNLYEFDCGELSGWMYKVNDWFPNYGCSRYGLKDGDVVELVYTCSLGADVGGFYSTGGE
ncbi:MAG TPA: hypothetical protein DCM73_16935 [Clostridiales bacterium]|nr:hypothetical protein [Clostridiales bacterium]